MRFTKTPKITINFANAVSKFRFERSEKLISTNFANAVSKFRFERSEKLISINFATAGC